MTNNEAMRVRGQHQTSTTISDAIAEGMEITQLWTNEMPGDRGVSVVEFDYGKSIAVVTNGDAEWKGDPFSHVVAEVEAAYQ